MNILVLDDDPDDFKHYFSALKVEDLVTYATTPELAQAAMEMRSFDVMLLDGNLDWRGRMQGPNVLRKWKAEGVKLPQVFMFSSDSALNDAGVKAGADGVFSKMDLCAEGVEGLRKLLNAD
jgi:DNA-binding response OmpR family regulator